MFVVNLCTVSIGLLHGVSRVRAARRVMLYVDKLVSGLEALPPNLPLKDAEVACQGHSLPLVLSPMTSLFRAPPPAASPDESSSRLPEQVPLNSRSPATLELPPVGEEDNPSST